MQKQINFPDVIRIESCGSCNFSCIHCPNGYSDTKSKRGNMSPQIFNSLLEQFHTHNFIPRVVVFYHGGEPLLNNNLPNMISTLKKLGVQKTVITTNTSLLTKESSLKLQKVGLDELQVSYDGCSPQENDYIRKNGNFSENSKNLLFFLQNNRHTNVIISNVQICTEKELTDIQNGIPLKTPDYLYTIFSKYKKVSFKSYPAMIWPGFKNTGKFKTKTFKNEIPTSCPMFDETITVLSTGDIVPCCYDITGEAILGNILHENIFFIRNNQRSQNFYNALSTGNIKDLPSVCQKCLFIAQKYLIK